MTCCFHFIAPLRGCTDNDIAFMQEVSKWVPIVPVIAQADKMTSEETSRFRKTVSDTLKQANIRCYDFGQDRQTLARCGFAQARRARDDDPVAPDVLARVAAAGDPPVFTLIADRREYAWGTCEMENADHSDFTLLRDLVIQGHLEASNTNITDELTKLMKSQQAFSASSRLMQAATDVSKRLID